MKIFSSTHWRLTHEKYFFDWSCARVSRNNKQRWEQTDNPEFEHGTVLSRKYYKSVLYTLVLNSGNYQQYYKTRFKTSRSLTNMIQVFNNILNRFNVFWKMLGLPWQEILSWWNSNKPHSTITLDIRINKQSIKPWTLITPVWSLATKIRKYSTIFNLKRSTINIMKTMFSSWNIGLYIFKILEKY